MHVEFPRCLHGAGGKTLIVHNEEDRDRELASGHWFLRPVTDAPVPEPVAEPVTADEPTRGWAPPDAPKKRGRKPSVN